MTHYKTITLPGPNLEDVRRFLREYGTDLAKAAHNKPGGPAASAQVLLLCEAVRHTRRLTGRQSSQLEEFYQLLTLEDVGDPDRIENGIPADINPSSGFVNGYCLLSEFPSALLLRIAESDLISVLNCDALRMIPQVA